MKQDLSLSQLCRTLNDLSVQKKDYLLPANELIIKSYSGKSYLDVAGTHFLIQERAASQLSSIARIPYSYYRRLELEYPELLDQNVNTLLAKLGKNRLVRTLGGKVRAILSDRYRKIEHETVMETLLPILDSIKGCEVVSSSLTADRLYLKAVCKFEKSEVKVGDSVAWGIVLTNSVTGCSSIVLQPFAMVLKCTNGMVLPRYYGSTRHIHLGKQIIDIETYDSLYDSEKDNLPTIIRGEIQSILNPESYNSVVEKMRAATEIHIPYFINTLEKIVALYSLSETEKELISYYYNVGKDYSLWGLVNSVTETSKYAKSYTRAHELETIGSQLLYYGVSTMNPGNGNPLLLSV